jgi:hypothetical protein
MALETKHLFLSELHKANLDETSAVSVLFRMAGNFMKPKYNLELSYMATLVPREE